MSNLTPVPSWDDVLQLDTAGPNAVAVGGPGGTMNKQAQALLNRFQFLGQTGGSVKVGYDGGTAQDVFDSFKPMANYTALRAYTGRATGLRITQTGLEGFFFRDASDTTTADDGGTVIVDASGRRWKRQFTFAVNIRWFGAVGNGVADDTTPTQTAINVCLANGYRLDVPVGKFRLTSQVNVPVFSNVFERGIIFKGEGWASRFVIDHTGVGFYVTCSPSFGIYQAVFEDIYFTDGTSSPDKIIHNNGAINTLVRNCIFHNATVTTACVVNDNAYGLRLQNCIFASIVGTGAFYAQVADISTYSFVNSIRDCDFSTCTVGVNVQGCNAFEMSNTVFQECSTGFAANPIASATTAFNISWDTCWFERNTTCDIQLSSNLSYWCEGSLRNCQFSGFDPAYQGHIQLGQKSKITIEGTPTGNTVLVSGSDDAAAVLIRATNFVQVGTFSWTELQPNGRIITPGMQVDASGNLLVGTAVTNGDPANVKKITAGKFSSLTGTVTGATNGTVKDLVTLPNVNRYSTWLVTVALKTGDATNWSTTALIQTQDASSFVTILRQSAQPLSITTSGLTFRASQSSGATADIEWNATRIA